MRGRGAGTPFETSEACLLLGANRPMLWCGLRMWTKSAAWQPCATTKVFPSSRLALAPVLRGESVLYRYNGVLHLSIRVLACGTSATEWGPRG